MVDPKPPGKGRGPTRKLAPSATTPVLFRLEYTAPPPLLVVRPWTPRFSHFARKQRGRVRFQDLVPSGLERICDIWHPGLSQYPGLFCSTQAVLSCRKESAPGAILPPAPQKPSSRDESSHGNHRRRRDISSADTAKILRHVPRCHEHVSTHVDRI